MPIKFYSISIGGSTVRWNFSSFEELYDAYYSDDPDIPDNSDLIRHVYLGNTPLFVENVITEPTFGYLVKLLGVDDA